MRQTTVIVWDTILTILALLAAYRLRNSFLPEIQSVDFYIPFLIFSVLALWLALNIFHLYHNHRPALSFSYLVDFLRALTLWGALLITFAFFTKTDYSRAVVILFFVFSILLLFIARLIIVRNKTDRQADGDTETHQIINELVKISSFSSDELALLEGVRQARAPSEIYFLSKRFSDLFLGGLGLIITLPFYPLIIFFIKKDGPGPAVIRQERVGQNGRKFILYKFRTMHPATALYAAAPRRGDDPRITKIGKWLRQYSLDELPQFFNVLRGEMSLVGPRPEMTFIVSGYTKWQKMRLAVKPGITGIWQILGRKDRPLEENIEYDLYYIFHQSFFLDLAILLRTIPHLLFPRGAY